MALTRGSIVARLAVLVALGGIAAAVGFGYLGRLHPALDSFSHFRIHLAALAMLLAPVLMLLRFRTEAAGALLLGAAVILQTAGLPSFSRMGTTSAAATDVEAGGAIYRLLHLNLRYDNRTPAAVLSLIGTVKPDIVTLNEVSEAWGEQLALIEAAYPHRIVCPQPSHVGGVAILSRRPFAEDFAPTCGDRGSFARVRLDIGGQPVDIATLHLGWPWPFEQPWQLRQVPGLLGDLGDTAIIAGDLNAVPWSHTARAIAAASGARILRSIGPTWLFFSLPDRLRPLAGLPIDNVMLKGGVLTLSARTLDAVGSDHLPVLVEFMLLPAEKAPQVLRAMLGE